MNLKEFWKNIKNEFHYEQLNKDLTLVYELKYIKKTLERYSHDA